MLPTLDHVATPNEARYKELSAVIKDPTKAFLIEGETATEKYTNASRTAGEIFAIKLEPYTSPASPEFKPYHRAEHTEAVVQATTKTFRVLQKEAPWFLVNMTKSDFEALPESERTDLLEKEHLYLRVLALGHDVIQNGSRNQTNHMWMRRRGIEDDQNEGQSALEVYDVITRLKDAQGQKLLDGYDLERVKADIRVTYPEAVSPEKFLALRQPYLHRGTSAAGIILALADTKMLSISGESALSGSALLEYSRDTGDAEFCELNPTFHEKYQKWDELNEGEKIGLYKSASKWLTLQKEFYSYQAEDLELRLAPVEISDADITIQGDYTRSPSTQKGLIQDEAARKALTNLFSPDRMKFVADSAVQRSQEWKSKVELISESGEVTGYNFEEMRKMLDEIHTHGYGAPETVTDIVDTISMLS